MARPIVPPDARRNHLVQATITTGELALLDELRAKLGTDNQPLTRSALLRSALNALAAEQLGDRS